MIYFILILSIILIAAIVAGAVWFTSYNRRRIQGERMPKETGKAERSAFHWRHIIVPVAILLLSILASAYFYRLLPNEVAYHFKLDGTPDRWFSRGTALAWGLIPQLLLALLAAAIAWVVTKLRIFSRLPDSTWKNPEGMLSIMCNMIALPQIIAFFAMLNIFSYNSYQAHIMPMWIFLLVILGLATITLMLLLALIFSRARRQYTSQPKN